MITDNLSRADIYKGISKKIADGLDFLINATSYIQLGEYVISDSVKAIVSEYITKSVFAPGYEAHKRVVDIQYPIIGVERIKWSPLDNMSIKTPYNEQKDCGYYTDPSQETYVDIGNGIFAIMFPNDAHCPQLFVNKPELIKKITIKINC
jgi:YhcH/YjgK/YiaL family protein